ncbi:MAG: TonB-dependent receptor [Rhodanobacteraceae bacterium]
MKRANQPHRHACSILALACAQAFAQNASPPQSAPATPMPDQNIQTLEQITVTGTHIRSIDLETQHPLLVLKREDLLRTGLTDIADIVQAIVINGQTQNRNINNGNDGRQLVDLRSLGANRTLVLINGQRWVAGLDGAVDLSAIPLALVERVEVLRDGASAIYGSDAIAGVINIITRKDYQGAEAGAYFGETDHDDGIRRDFDFTYGHSGDRWSAAFGLDYAKDDSIFAGDRAISAVPIAGLPLGATGFPFLAFLYHGPTVLIPGRPGTSPDDFRPFDFATDLSFNYAPINYLQTPLERKAVFAQGRYELTPTLSVSADVLFNQRRSVQQLAPPPIRFGSVLGNGPDGFDVAADNIYNPFGQAIRRVSRRLTEAGPRRFEQTVDTARAHLGLDGLFEIAGHSVAWGADASHTRANQREFTDPYADNARLALAVGPSFFDANGVARCGTPDAVIAGCVPLDVFGPPGSVTPAMLDYIDASVHNRTRSDNSDYNLHATTALFDLPAGPLNIAVGAERRRESGRDDPDDLLASGRANGTGVTYVSTTGAYSVNEAYVEFDVPLLKEHAFARQLDLSVATRWSDYSLFGSTTNSQVGLRWKPIDDLLLRANYEQGFRAPSVLDLFGGAVQTGDGFTDPCAAVNHPTPVVMARCAALGVPADVVDQGGSAVTIGGNPALQPETARTRTIGFVYDPAWLPGLHASLDWYRIQIQHAIGQRTGQAVVDACYKLGDPAACAQIVRNPNDGSIFHVNETQQNIPGGLETDGYDFTLAWRRATRFGQFDLSWDNAYVTYYGELGKPARGSLLPDGSPAQGNVVALDTQPGGFFGVVWRLRSVMSFAWQRGAWSASIGARYFSPITEDCSSVTNIADTVGDPSLRNLCSDPDHLQDGQPAPLNRVGAVTYIDLQAGWNAPWKGRFVLGVRNAFDRNPPVSYSAFENSYFPDYDIPGRFWYASYRQKL